MMNMSCQTIGYQNDPEFDEGYTCQVSGYCLKSVKALFEQYAFENGRVCQEDAETTKRYIRNEMYRRLESALNALETAEGDKDADRIYRYFVEH